MRLRHVEYYLNMLNLVSARSTCGRRSVGAILVDEHNRILSTGYNGVPPRYPHCTEVACTGHNDQPGDSSRCAAIHAEVNAILQCHRIDLIHTLYVSAAPCYTCAKMLCNTNLKQVVCLETYADAKGRELLEAQGILFVVATGFKL